MAAIDLNLDPSDKQLRQFGLISLVALPLLGWLFMGKPMPASWEAIHTQRIGALAVVGLVAGLAAWLRPGLLKWIFVAISVVTFPIGFVLGEVIMVAIFAIAFVPMALLFRVVRRDALQRNIDRTADTYWQAKEQPKNTTSYYRQS